MRCSRIRSITCSTSGCSAFGGGTNIATGFPFRAKDERLPTYLPVFERALRDFEDLRRAGAASLDLAWTASGVFDGYFEQALGTFDHANNWLL